jgi:hypothetical protein
MPWQGPMIFTKAPSAARRVGRQEAAHCADSATGADGRVDRVQAGTLPFWHNRGFGVAGRDLD